MTMQDEEQRINCICYLFLIFLIGCLAGWIHRCIFSRILVEIFEFANGQVNAKMLGFLKLIEEKLVILIAPAMHQLCTMPWV